MRNSRNMRRNGPSRPYSPSPQHGGFGLTEPASNPSGPGGRYYDPPSTPRRHGRGNIGDYIPPGKSGVPNVPWRAARELGRRGLRLVPFINGLLLLEDGFRWMQPDSPVFTPNVFTPGVSWTRCPNPNVACTATWGQDDFWRYQSAVSCGALGSCPTNQGLPSPLVRVAPGTPTTPGAKVLFRWQITNVPLQRGTVFEQWIRPNGPTDSPTYTPGAIILPDQPDPWDEPSPMAQPKPMSYPKTDTPTRLADRFRPGAQTGWRPGPGPGVGNDPRPNPGGPVPPWVPPGTQYGPDDPRGTPSPHWPARPRPGDKEKKPPPIDYGPLGKWYGAATELNDLLDCMAEAMDKPKPTGPIPKRLKYIWDSMGDPDQMDPVAFGKCMAMNNAKDKLIGKLSRGAARAMNSSPYASSRPGGYRGSGGSTRMHSL